jgi:hypothetical protein
VFVALLSLSLLHDGSGDKECGTAKYPTFERSENVVIFWWRLEYGLDIQVDFFC